jgi:hypothetical protein
MCITVDGVHSKTSAGTSAILINGIPRPARLKETKEAVKTFNAYLDDLQSKITKLIRFYRRLTCLSLLKT